MTSCHSLFVEEQLLTTYRQKDEQIGNGWRSPAWRMLDICPPPWKPFLLKLPSRIYRAICTACFVVWRPCRAADTSTNRRHGFLCRRTASMEQAADTAEAAAVDHYFSSSTENVSVSVCLWTPGYRQMIALWSALGLPVGGAILIPHLQL